MSYIYNQISHKYKKKNKSQPIFYFNQDKEFEIKAGGVVFYYYDETDMDLKFLMIKNREKYEDFGGKTEKKDSCIEETIAREVEEESNSIFSKERILKKIKEYNPIYTKNSKYLVYFYRLRQCERYNPIIFGDREIYEDVPRTVEWISYSQIKNPKFIKSSLSYRLRFKDFFKKIEKLYDYHKSLDNPVAPDDNAKTRSIAIAS